MSDKTQYTEKQAVQLPFVELLINMGWQYLPHEQLGESKQQRYHNILSEITFDSLNKINSYDYLGNTHKFSPKSIQSAIDKLETISFDGIVPTSQSIYNLLMTGSTEKEELGDFDIKFFDFENLENNTFHVAVEHTVAGKLKNARLDIVLFINGIPIAVIENKAQTVDLNDAIKDLVYYQTEDIAAKFFAFPQLVIASNGTGLKYGTTNTPKKFYSNWKNPDFNKEDFTELTSKSINLPVYNNLLADLGLQDHSQVLDRPMLQQDMSVISMLKKDTILEFIRNFIIFETDDGRLIKKAARYQQFYAVEAINKRIRLFKDNETKRRGGIVWHTQGSGKSLTMVMFAKSLISCEDIESPRLVIVTDRVNLDSQIKGTFENCHLKNNVVQAKSKNDLLDKLNSNSSDVITTLIHKFEKSDVKLEDKNIFVLIDEAHSSQSGEMHEAMKETLPNASYIGFTGTPLMTENKTTLQQFDEGEYSYIHKYTIDQALDDKAILPLVYDPRFSEQTVINADKLDKDIDEIYEKEDLSETDKVKLQKKIRSKQWASEQSGRIEKIALDIELHFKENFQGTGLKGQLIAPSKRCAIMFNEALKDKINCAVIISEENGKDIDTNEEKADVAAFIKEHAVSGSFSTYEKNAINSFKKEEGGVELLIVVSKLITGFDAPRNTVLYLTKKLKEHLLLQAIARVNRLYDENKQTGFIMDYSANAKNIQEALDLFSSYDKDDVRSVVFDPKSKFAELESSYFYLLDLFKGKVETKHQDKLEAYYESLEPENIRADFYYRVNKFLKLLKDCRCFAQYIKISERKRNNYSRDAKMFFKLKQAVQKMYSDSFDAKDFKSTIMKVLDNNTTAEDVKRMAEPVDITSKDFIKQIEQEFGKEDAKSLAKTIANQTKSYISQRYNQDKAFYETYSKKLQEIFDDLKNDKIVDLFDLLEKTKEIRHKVINKKIDDVPTEIIEEKGSDIIYRNIKSMKLESLKNKTEDEYKDFILALTKRVKSKASIDFHKNTEKLNKLKTYGFLIDNYDDFLSGNDEDMMKISDEILNIAKENPEEFYP
jgi:type I restriction enzyme R subunit